jgi:acetolactate synthase-1/2/3 large subunit
MAETDVGAKASKVAPADPATGAGFIAHTLHGYGVSHVFFMESILRQTLIELEALGVRRVLAHSEAGAVYMADGYARIARRAGVCMAQSVGAANMAAALQDPFLGQSPVLALTGKKLPSAQHRNAYQEIAHAPMYSAVTKFDASVETVEQLPRLLRQALREAVSGAPGPVHLDIAGGWGGQAIETAAMSAPVVVDTGFTRVPAVRPLPEPDCLREAAHRLSSAERPVIVAGGGARASGAGPAIQRLAEALSIPVATSLSAKGIVPDDHPLAVGVVGSYSRWSANRAVHGADLVLFVGSHTGDQVTNDWTVPEPGVPVIQIDIDPAELGRSYPAAIAIQGDAKRAVEGLLELVRPRGAPSPWALECAALVREWNVQYTAACASNARPIRPERLCREIGVALPERGILVSDTGYSGIWSGTLVPLTRPGQEYIRAAGSLGWAFPAALGAKCAAPDRPVVCFTGDGGFWYHLSEMETALRCGINVVAVINNNSGFGQCIDAINRNYGERAGNPRELHAFRPTDFAAIANAMGCMGIRVEHPEHIADALRTGLCAERPTIIDVVTDETARAPAPWFPPARK